MEGAQSRTAAASLRKGSLEVVWVSDYTLALTTFALINKDVKLNTHEIKVRLHNL